MKKLTSLLSLVLLLTACQTDNAPYNEYDFANGGPDAPLYNERTATFMQADNQFAHIDSNRPISPEEIEASNKKWNTARMQTRWQEYRGTMVRIQILLGDSDLREMRLRLMQSADGMDIDGDARTVLAKVADFKMKRVCGRKADSIVIVYDRPSFDAMRPTPYFDYRMDAEGATMREYGFRCIYND